MRERPYRGLILLTAACGLLIAIVGCGPSGPERIAVSGTVTYQGQPVPGGTIYFVPCQGTAGLPGYAAITDGQYYVKTDGGLPVGDFQVKVEAYRDRSGAAQPATDRGFGLRERRREQYIPAKYNAKTELKLAVKSGAGSIRQDFDLCD